MGPLTFAFNGALSATLACLFNWKWNKFIYHNNINIFNFIWIKINKQYHILIVLCFFHSKLWVLVEFLLEFKSCSLQLHQSWEFIYPILDHCSQSPILPFFVFSTFLNTCPQAQERVDLD